MSRPTPQNLTNAFIVRQSDGVHQELRTAATAKFFHETFPEHFPTETEIPHSDGILIPSVDSAIMQLWHGFRALWPNGKSSCEAVILHTKKLIEAPVDHWDTAEFYSNKVKRQLSVTMPLKHVLAAIATLIIDNGDTYFQEQDSSAARRDRLVQLFTNLQQLKDGPDLCHTGIRDAFVVVMNGVAFQHHEEACCYRFPESLPAFLQALQAEYIQQAFRDYKTTHPSDYQKHMVEWAALPDIKREMPDALKGIVARFINTAKSQNHYKNTLLSVGMNPRDTNVTKLYPHYFTFSALEFVDINAALGSAVYWHDVSRIFSLSDSSHAPYNARLKQLKAAIRSCRIDRTQLRALHYQMQHFIKVVLCANYLRTHRAELSYQYESGTMVCDKAKSVVDTYYAHKNPTLLSPEQSQILDRLIKQVDQYRQAPLINEFSNVFSLLFLEDGAIEHRQAQKIADHAFRNKCKIDSTWLESHFSAERAHDGELEIHLATLNHLLLHVLLYPKTDWCDGTEEALTISLDYLKTRLGNAETDALEREQHLRLKQNSYQPLFTLLECLADDSLIGSMNNEQLLGLIRQVIKCNFYSLSSSIAELLAANNERRSWLAAHEDIQVLLWDKAYDGNREAVLFLLNDLNIDVNTAMPDSVTALFIAARYAHLDVVNVLLAADGIDVNAAGPLGATALFIAAQEGHLHVVNALLAANGIDVNAAMTDGCTALFIAAQQGHLHVVNALLAANGIDVNAAMTNGCTALYIAALKGHLGVVNALLAANGINVNAAGPGGITMLFMAAQEGHLHVVNSLLAANGIDVNAAMTNGATALFIAAAKGHLDVVNALLAANDIAVNAARTDGCTALFMAALKGHLHVVNALLATNGIDVNAAKANGRTALFIAAQKGHLHVVNALLATNGIDVNAALLICASSELRQFIQNKSPAVQKRMCDHIKAFANQQEIHITPAQIARIMGHDAIAMVLELRTAPQNSRTLPSRESSTATSLRQNEHTLFTSPPRNNTSNDTTIASSRNGSGCTYGPVAKRLRAKI